MADEYIERMIYGKLARRSVPRSKWTATCKRCGMAGLKWRAEAEGWRLFENERVEHNRLKEHVCKQDQPSTEGFKDVD